MEIIIVMVMADGITEAIAAADVSSIINCHANGNDYASCSQCQ